MFRHSVKFKKVFALLIPLTFIWSWAACSVICSENVEHHQNENARADKWTEEVSLGTTDREDDCPVLKLTALNSQERHNVNVSLPTIIETKFSFQNPLSLSAFLIPEAKQNSPPTVTSTPLFVQFCNFRI